MSDLPRTAKVWELTQESFDDFLTHLDPDRELAGRKYEILRHKLVKFFEWRGSLFPEELADVTLNRLARKIHTGPKRVDDPVSYAFGVARKVNQESLKARRKEELMAREESMRNEVCEENAEELRFECFQQCLRHLDPTDRELITSYYGEEKRVKINSRRALAERLKVTLNTLRIRTHRIRSKLEQCVLDCMEATSAR
jgi:RNA polymerase sigma factor (sigma-70 family)